VRALPVCLLRLVISMYAGGSIFLFTIGAILYFALRIQLQQVDLHMVGLILMVVGVVGLLMALIGSATMRRRTP